MREIIDSFRSELIRTAKECFLDAKEDVVSLIDLLSDDSVTDELFVWMSSICVEFFDKAPFHLEGEGEYVNDHMN